MLVHFVEYLDTDSVKISSTSSDKIRQDACFHEMCMFSRNKINIYNSCSRPTSFAQYSKLDHD